MSGARAARLVCSEPRERGGWNSPTVFPLLQTLSPPQHRRAHHFPLSIYDLFLKHHVNPSLHDAISTGVLLANAPFEEIFPQIPLLPVAKPWTPWDKEPCPGAAAATRGTQRYHPKLECVREGENRDMGRSRAAEQLQAFLLSFSSICSPGILPRSCPTAESWQKIVKLGNFSFLAQAFSLERRPPLFYCIFFRLQNLITSL